MRAKEFERENPDSAKINDLVKLGDKGQLYSVKVVRVDSNPNPKKIALVDVWKIENQVQMESNFYP